MHLLTAASLLICNLILASYASDHLPMASSMSTEVTSVFYSGPSLSETPTTRSPSNVNGADDEAVHAPKDGSAHAIGKRDLNEQIRHMAHEQQQRAVGNHTHISGCQTCRKVHMDMKQATLDHIKGYMLARLGFNVSGPPKRDSWPVVPRYIVDEFQSSQSERNTGNVHEWDEERMNHQNQQKYLDSFPGTAVDQDYVGDEPSWIQRMAQPEDTGPTVKTTRIYLFPNITKLRHQQHELMSFEFPVAMAKRKKTHPSSKGGDHSALNPLLYLDVTKALLHISFCNEHDSPALLDDLRNHLSRKSPVKVSVHRVIVKEHRNLSSEKFSKEEVTVDVPMDLLESLLADSTSTSRMCRKYLKLDLTQMVKDWYKSSKKNHGLFVALEPPRLKNLLSLKATENKPFLELWTTNSRKKRVKRSINLRCKEEDHERRCCMYPLTVDFERFGWDFIIAPKRYEANYCAGECAINYQTSYTHTHVMQLSTSAPACCAPKQMKPLKLLYFNRKDQVMQTELENMIVETCACS